MARPLPPARNSARLAAVQALYEIDATSAPAGPVLTEFLNKRWQNSVVDEDDKPVDITEFDRELLSDIVEGVMRHQHSLDCEIAGGLSEQWTLDRLEILMRAILRAGVYELTNHIHIPTGVVISEYMDVASAFYGTNEPTMVNGVLDRLARQIRVSGA